MNNIILTGNLASEPELRFTSTGTPHCKFTLAVSQGKEKEAFFIDCEVWNDDISENVAVLGKGSRITVVGRLKEDKWEYEGKKYSKFAVTAQDVAVSCRWQKVTAEKNKK